MRLGRVVALFVGLVFGLAAHREMRGDSVAAESLFARVTFVVPGEPTYVQAEVRYQGLDLGGLLWITPSQYAGFAALNHTYELVRFHEPPALGLTVKILDKQVQEKDVVLVYGTAFVYAIPPVADAGPMRFRLRPEAAAVLVVGEEYLFQE